jgi:cytochrome P450
MKLSFLLIRLREEVDRVLGERSEITYADIGELKYCASVFKETLRLWPPAPLFDRITSEPMRIGNYDVPKNTWVFVSLNLFFFILHMRRFFC